MHETPAIRAVLNKEKESFLAMAKQYFIELNPLFVPHEDWEAQYFESLQSNENLSLRWIILGEDLVGFIIFGVENHRFLSRKTGVIYELYILPEYRGQGIAQTSAVQVVNELHQYGISKVQLEVTEGNTRAVAFWERLGFQKVSSRYILQDQRK